MMDLVTIAKLGSLLRATIADYTIVHEKMTPVLALVEELETADSNEYLEISRKYLSAIESYLIANDILKIQYKNLQIFAHEIPHRESVKHRDITKAQLELMLLDLDHLKRLPVLRNAVKTINETLISAGVIRDETLTMSGVVKDGEIRI